METFGSVEKKEQVEVILEQVRFFLGVKECILTQIICKKIDT
jgi:hypothetical protein